MRGQGFVLHPLNLIEGTVGVGLGNFGIKPFTSGLNWRQQEFYGIRYHRGGIEASLYE